MMTTMNMTLLTMDGTMMMISGTKTLPLMSFHPPTPPTPLTPTTLPTPLMLQTPPRPKTRLIKKRMTQTTST
jgi:hypothetical protein